MEIKNKIRKYETVLHKKGRNHARINKDVVSK